MRSTPRRASPHSRSRSNGCGSARSRGTQGRRWLHLAAARTRSRPIGVDRASKSVQVRRHMSPPSAAANGASRRPPLAESSVRSYYGDLYVRSQPPRTADADSCTGVCHSASPPHRRHTTDHVGCASPRSVRAANCRPGSVAALQQAPPYSGPGAPREQSRQSCCRYLRGSAEGSGGYQPAGVR